MSVGGANTAGLPAYAALPDGNARGVFGAQDRVGSLNRQTPESVRAAASLVQTGEVFSLNAPLNWPDPPLFSRSAVRHTVLRTALGNLDDVVDNFFPQGSSQWDGFAHIKDPEVGYYNGLAPHELGVDAWAQRGIAGRGVLLDMGRFRQLQGRPLHWHTKDVLTIEELEECRRQAGIECRAGDILVVRTGWTEGYQAASATEQAAVRTDPTSPGLADGRDMVEYLWDWGISAIASDNIAVEAIPPGPAALHPHLLSRLGIPIGELWWLEELAAACAADGRYEFLLTSAPLNLPGAAGSPANALALR